MVPSKEDHLLGIFKFERHEQTDCFKAETAAIDVVTQKDVVKSLDITLLARPLPNIEKAHEVCVVAMQVTKDLERRFQSLYQDRLGL